MSSPQNIYISETTGEAPQIAHRYVPVSVFIPHMCALCTDFVLSPDINGARQCSACYHIFHKRCWLTASHRKQTCRRLRQRITTGGSSDGAPSSTSTPTVETLQLGGDGGAFFGVQDSGISTVKSNPVEQWSSYQILQWLIVVGLSRFVELFKTRALTGVSLSELVDINTIPDPVKDPFHKRAIQQAALVLLGHLPYPGGVLDHISETDEHLPACPNAHTPRIMTFLQEMICSHCGYPLLGVQKQGFQCTTCGCIFHRICFAQDCLLPCNANPHFQSTVSTVFGVSLDNQELDDELNVPIFLIALIKEFEKQGLSNSSDLFDCLRKTATSSDMQELVTAYSHGVTSSESLDKRSLPEIAQIIKWYLRELPDSVIPASLYEDLVVAASDKDETIRNSQIVQLIRSISSPVHLHTLYYIMQHYDTVWQHQQNIRRQERLTKWSQVMCHILIRPSWDISPVIVGRSDMHIRILETLIRSIPLWKPGSPQPERVEMRRQPSRPSPSPNSTSTASQDTMAFRFGGSCSTVSTPCSTAPVQDLAQVDWYWADISKEEVHLMMSGLPDGSFLVRDTSSNHAGYTLTVRKCGENKLIRIYHSNGFYGFIDPPPELFSSVVQLLEYYQVNSLVTYNSQLDLKLTNPVSKRHHLGGNAAEAAELSEDNLIHALRTTEEELRLRSETIENETDSYDRCQQELLDTNVLIRLQTKLKTWFVEQYDTLDFLKSGVETEPDRERVKMQLLHLRQRLQTVDEKLVFQQQRQEAISTDIRCLLNSLNISQLEVKKLVRKQQQITRLLRDKGISDQDLHVQDDKADEIYFRIKEKLSGTLHPRKRETWFVKCSREECTALLQNKPTGTFLIRPSAAKDKLALGVKLDDTVKQCLIHRSSTGMYGFVPTNCIFESLESLVEHYHVHSLMQHNETLNTTLKYPVMSEPMGDKYYTFLPG